MSLLSTTAIYDLINVNHIYLWPCYVHFPRLIDADLSTIWVHKSLTNNSRLTSSKSWSINNVNNIWSTPPTWLHACPFPRWVNPTWQTLSNERWLLVDIMQGGRKCQSFTTAASMCKDRRCSSIPGYSQFHMIGSFLQRKSGKPNSLSTFCPRSLAHALHRRSLPTEGATWVS